ncbi:MAG: disulfide bond formation protein B [Acinetobacter sp.]|jgi:disulfide bond formation protein DsbB|nr:MAG: disulfide bond formation protein B [Acinetobacter sp.]
MQLNYRLVNALLVLASIVGIAFALYLEHVQGLNPCPLCVFQRVGLIAMGLVALIALIHHPKKRWARRGYSVFSTLAIGWSFGVAARHVWLQHLPPDKVPACGPGLDYLVEALPFKQVLSQVLTGSGECATIDWSFLGQSLPFWSLLFFTGLLLLNLWQLIRK